MNGEYAQYLAADFLCHILPRRLLYRIAVGVANRFFLHDEKGRRAVISNLRRIHEHQGLHPSEEAVEAMARNTFHNFGKYVADFFRFSRVSRKEMSELMRVAHPEYIGEAAARGKGVLAVTAHLGNWEIGGAMLASYGYHVNVVVMPMKDGRTNALFQDRRERRGLKVMPVGDAARGIFSALFRKEFVALLADRDYSAHQHQTVFFGAPASLPLGPAKLCVRTGAPILPGFLVRQPDDTFLLRMHPAIQADGLSTEEVQDRLRRVLEEEISRNPSQWFIFDDFWKNGVASSQSVQEAHPR